MYFMRIGGRGRGAVDMWLHGADRLKICLVALRWKHKPAHIGI